MSGHNRRVSRLETELTPQAKVIVVDWYEDCEPREAAIARAGETGPHDVVMICATWATCTRPPGHTHRDAEVIIHPRVG